MLKNYLTITLRTLNRQRAYTAVNITGLALAFAVCVLMGLYIYDEWRVDRFHEHADRIVQIVHETPAFGRQLSTSYPLAGVLNEDVPAVEVATRVHRSAQRVSARPDDETDERQMLLVEPAFFEIFSFRPKSGDVSAVLESTEMVLLTEEMAHRFFGDEDPIGREVYLGEGPAATTLTVGGIVEDPPSYSTLRFDVISSFNRVGDRMRRPDGWGGYMFNTYALLHHAADINVVEAQILRALEPHFDDRPPGTLAVPLPSVYLSEDYRAPGFRGQLKYLYIFGGAALFVLLIAGINYINMATVQGMKRAKEIGVRKTLGAAPRQLAGQFLCESVLVSFAALLAALVIVPLVLPAFNEVFDKDLSLADGRTFWFPLMIVVLVFGLMAGAYPALVLARFRPIFAIRNRAAGRSGRGGVILRKTLVVTQFAVSLLLIIGVAVIYYQLHYMQTKDLGFEGENVLVADLRSDEAWRMREELRERIRMHPGVRSASIASAIPGGFSLALILEPEEVSPQASTEQERILFQPAVVDPFFAETLDLRVIAGRNFSPDHPSDAARAHMLNESAVRALGWSPQEAVGKPVASGRDELGEVIGVVEDFHVASLHREIPPVMLRLHEVPGMWSAGRLMVRFEAGAAQDIIRHVEQHLKEYAPGFPFRYQFLDESFRAYYESDFRFRQIVTGFALLAILIACLGLFGLAAYTAEQRTKEIGIRKVLGATVTSVVTLLSKDFARLVLIATVIAAPVGYYVMSRWLEDFAYRIEISWWIFALAGGIALAIALLTVSSQAVKAAVRNPVEALRYE